MMSGEPRPVLTGSDDASNSAEANTDAETEANVNKNGITAAEEVNTDGSDRDPGDPTTRQISNIMENLNIAEEGEAFIEPESEVCT